MDRQLIYGVAGARQHFERICAHFIRSQFPDEKGGRVQRLKPLTLSELLERLGHRLAVLTGGPRDLPIRQQTLRGTIDWSHDLLSLEERRLFRLLAVFPTSIVSIAKWDP